MVRKCNNGRRKNERRSIATPVNSFLSLLDPASLFHRKPSTHRKSNKWNRLRNRLGKREEKSFVASICKYSWYVIALVQEIIFYTSAA